jgi:hypothetical protein
VAVRKLIGHLCLPGGASYHDAIAIMADRKEEEMDGVDLIIDALAAGVATKAYLDDDVTNRALRLLQLVGAEQSTSGRSGDAHIRVSNSSGVQINTGEAKGFQHNVSGACEKH